MKSNEVRIGNYIKTDMPFHFAEIRGGIVQVMIANIEEVCGLLSVNEDFFKPIPLTPEILEKAGFEKKLNMWDNLLLYKVIPMFDSKVYIVFAETEDGHWTGSGRVADDIEPGEHIYFTNTEKSVLESLHQLQNLYYSLTGEELQINL